MFVTTSKASVLSQLEVDMDFEKKVAVPPVQTFGELGEIMTESKVFDPQDIRGTLHRLQEVTQQDTVGLGVKAVLDCIFEARTAAEDMPSVFVDLMSTAINSR